MGFLVRVDIVSGRRAVDGRNGDATSAKLRKSVAHGEEPAETADKSIFSDNEIVLNVGVARSPGWTSIAFERTYGCRVPLVFHCHHTPCRPLATI